VGADTKEHTEVDAEGTDVGTGLDVHAEDGESASLVKVEELRRVDGTDTELTLDGRDEGRALEESTSESLETADNVGLLDLAVEAGDGDISLTGTLLGLDETRRAVKAHDQAASDLGVKGTRTTSLLNLEDTLDPADNLVARRVGGLVEVLEG
jgi:hypothetical protein